MRFTISRLTNAVLLCACVGVVSARASEVIPAKPQDYPIALKGATIHPVSGPEIANGTLIFADGKIAALGADTPIPEGTETIDVTGKQLYPGLINANSMLGLSEISAVRATLDFEETSEINPNASAITSINPDSELIPVARSNGILTALVAPEGGLISGQSAVIRLDGWTPQDLTVRAPAAMHLRWPKMEIDRRPRAPKKPEDQEKDIDKALKRIRDSFQLARAYAAAKKSPVPGFQSDLRWEALAQVVDGTLPLFVHADSVEQIESALAWAKNEGLKFT
ncbi:MAG: amidohydrolase family protein, partial [Chthoniobacterales bacterium]